MVPGFLVLVGFVLSLLAASLPASLEAGILFACGVALAVCAFFVKLRRWCYHR